MFTHSLGFNHQHIRCMILFLKTCQTLCLSGTKQSYGDPQDLTEIVREALKEKKPIADTTTNAKTAKQETKASPDPEKTESDEDVKKRSKI